MVADKAARPDVLPTDRLLDNGKARPELRADLRRIDDAAQRGHRGLGVAVGGA